MASVREQILEGLTTKVLTVPALQPGPRTRVFRSRVAALRTDEFPCAVIRPLGDEVTLEGCIQYRAHRLTVAVELFTQDEIPDKHLDPIEVAVDAAIMAQPRSFSGVTIIGIEPEASQYEVDEGDMGQTTLLYAIKYRTIMESIDVQQ